MPPPKENSGRKEELIRTLNLLAEKVERNEAIGAEDLSPVEEDKKARNAEHTQLAGQFAIGRGLDSKEAQAGKVNVKELSNLGVEIATNAAVLAVKVEHKGRLCLS